MADLHLRSQAERFAIADSLLTGLWEEIRLGCAQDGILQVAVDCQVMINRIVWKLNDIANSSEKEDNHG